MDPRSSGQKKGSNNPFPEVFGADGSDEDLGNTISKKRHPSNDTTQNQADQTKLGNSSVQSQQAEPPKMGLLFGQTQQTGGLFGSQNTGQPKTGGGLFTQATQQVTQGEQPKPLGLFGQSQQTGGLFSASQTTGAKPLFGQPSQGESPKPASPFGSQTGEAAKPANLFAGAGTINTQSGESPKPASLFSGTIGVQSSESPKPTSLFAGAGTTSTQSGEPAKPSSLFAGAGTTSTQSSEPAKPTGLFTGAGTTSTQSSESPKPTSLFTSAGAIGAQSGEPAKPGSLFSGTIGTQSGEPAKPTTLFTGVGTIGAQSGEPAKPISLFTGTGATSTQSSEPAKPTGLFAGAGAASTQSSESPKPASLFSGTIGVQSSEPAKPTSLFSGTTGAQSGEPAKPTNLFTGVGATSTQSSEPTKPTGLFVGVGTTNMQSSEPAKPASLFPGAGITSTQSSEPAKPAGLFAGSTTTQSGEASKPLFGQSQQTEVSKPTGGLFGGPQATGAKPLFGQPQQGESTKPATLFGAQTSEAGKPTWIMAGSPGTQSSEPAKPTFLFPGTAGTQSTTPTPAKPANLFPGAGTTSTQSSEPAKPTSLFPGAGNASTQSGQPSKPLFGQPQQTGGLFGVSQQTSGSKPLFGQPQQTEASKPTTLFGQQQQQTEQPKPTTLFGAQKTEPSKPEDASDLPAPPLGKKDSEIKFNIFGPISQNPVTQPAPGSIAASISQPSASTGNIFAVKTDKPGGASPFKDNEPKKFIAAGSNPALFGQAGQTSPGKLSVFSPQTPSPMAGFSGMLSEAKSTFLDKGISQPTTSLFSGVFNDSNPKPVAKPLFAGAKTGTESAEKSPIQGQPAAAVEFDIQKTFKDAFEKEKKVQDKLAILMKSIEENKRIFNSSLQNQEQEIDAFFEEYNKKVNQKVLEAVDKCKQNVKAKLRSEHQNYDAISTQVHVLLGEISQTNALSKVLDLALNDEKSLGIAKSGADKKEEAKRYLANSSELKSGYTPLVKKYKLLKSTLPSVRSLTSQSKSKVKTKDDLLECSEKVTSEVEKGIVTSLQKRLDHEIVRTPHPLQSFLGFIQAVAKAIPSVLPPKFPHDQSYAPHANAKHIKEVIYKLTPEEAKAIVNPGIFSKASELVYLTQPGSLHHEVLERDLISYQGAPRKIVKKVLASSQDSFDELSLENIITGKVEQVKLQNKQQQAQEAILAEDYLVTKVNKNTGCYTLMNLDNQKSNTRVLMKVVSPNQVLSTKIKADLERLLKDHQSAVVKTLFVDQEEIIVACDELRSKKAATA